MKRFIFISLSFGLLLKFSTLKIACADDMSSFAIGFNNGLTQAMGGQPYQGANPIYIEQPIQQPQVIVRPIYYDAIYNTGQPANMRFPTFTACRQYIWNNPSFGNCETIK